MFSKILGLLLLLTGTANAAYFPTFSINNFNALGVYNLVPPVLANGQTANLQLSSSGDLLIKINSQFGPLSFTSSQLPAALGAQLIANSMAVNIASDQVVPISVSALPLPSGASTSANQTAVQSAPGTPATTAITVQGNAAGVALPVSTSALPLPAGASTSANQATEIASLSSIDGKMNSLGQKVSSSSMPVVIASDQSAIPVSNASLPLPTGASTSANQATEIASLASIDGKIANNYGATAGAVRTASQVGNASGVADFGAGNGSAQTIRTVIASDQVAVQTKQAVNTTGSGSAAAATVSTVITLTAPVNAVGFLLMNLDTSTANVRWSIGRTASATLGQQLQPGRDTGFVPCGANVSLIAESGTQNYDLQWVSQ